MNVFDRRSLDFLVRGHKGMLVVGNLPAGGAILAEAGVVCGDVVLAVNGAPVRSWAELVAARDLREGTMTLTLFRDGAQMVVDVALPSRPSLAPMRLSSAPPPRGPVPLPSRASLPPVVATRTVPAAPAPIRAARTYVPPWLDGPQSATIGESEEIEELPPSAIESAPSSSLAMLLATDLPPPSRAAIAPPPPQDAAAEGGEMFELLPPSEPLLLVTRASTPPAAAPLDEANGRPLDETNGPRAASIVQAVTRPLWTSVPPPPDRATVRPRLSAPPPRARRSSPPPPLPSLPPHRAWGAESREARPRSARAEGGAPATNAPPARPSASALLLGALVAPAYERALDPPRPSNDDFGTSVARAASAVSLSDETEGEPTVTSDADDADDAHVSPDADDAHDAEDAEDAEDANVTPDDTHVAPDDADDAAVSGEHELAPRDRADDGVEDEPPGVARADASDDADFPSPACPCARRRVEGLRAAGRFPRARLLDRGGRRAAPCVNRYASSVSEEGTTFEGGCHCGKVRFRVYARELRALDCNCSVCVMKGFLHLIVARHDFELLAGEEELTTYTFGTRVAKHTFCRVCGVHPFYTPRSHPDGIDVNVRCLDDEVVSCFSIVPFDGRDWEANVASIR